MLMQSKKNNLNNILDNSIINLSTPTNISYLWNFGSILGLILISQIITGLLWASTYTPNINQSFITTISLMETLDKMWLIRYIHLNGASFFFLFMYMHMFRNLFYMSYKHTHTWMIGNSILIMSMMTAFVGYVLPMNQMSFWAASVITNLFSEIPYIGKNIVTTIWGGPSVSNPTVTRFYMMHFILPFIIIAMVMMHLLFLHNHGSSNPMGFKNYSKTPFHNLLTKKDTIGFLMVMMLMLLVITFKPMISMDSENFVKADPSTTPLHIQPEWYFLFAYAILRSIPNKMGGIIALAMSLLILYTMPFTYKNMMKSSNAYPLNKINIWLLISITIMLTWAGTKPVEQPFIFTTQILTLFYFSFFIINPSLILMNDKIIMK